MKQKNTLTPSTHILILTHVPPDKNNHTHSYIRIDLTCALVTMSLFNQVCDDDFRTKITQMLNNLCDHYVLLMHAAHSCHSQSISIVEQSRVQDDTKGQFLCNVGEPDNPVMRSFLTLV